VLVVAAAIVRDGRVLAGQRAYPAMLAGRWEFPGGKVEAGEAPRDALAREIREELGVEVAVHERLGEDVALSEAPVPGGGRLRLYHCSLRTAAASPVARHHLALRWIGAAELESPAWLATNCQLLPAVREFLVQVKR
jgi:8-oxo-dGTP diphosphatase